MARFSKLTVLSTAITQGMVPLFYHPDLEVAKQVISACYSGGSRILEFTNRGDFAHQIFEKLNKFCMTNLPDMILGVGSVSDQGTASLYMQLGANFVVTPSLRDDVVRVCNRRKIPCVPGCATLTEIGKAEELGCDIVKLFPGSVFGPDFVKAIKGPQKWTSVMPTGGVQPTKDNLSSWFSAGVTCVGMGSKLLQNSIIQEGKFERLSKDVRNALELIQEIKSQL